MNVPHAVTADEDPHDDQNVEASHSRNEDAHAPAPETASKSSRGRTNWDEVVEKLYKKKVNRNVQQTSDTNDPKQ